MQVTFVAAMKEPGRQGLIFGEQEEVWGINSNLIKGVEGRMAEISQATSSNNNLVLIIQEQSLDYSAISEVRVAGTVRVDNVIGAHFAFQ